jgi:hypothetical protein
MIRDEPVSGMKNSNKRRSETRVFQLGAHGPIPESIKKYLAPTFQSILMQPK